jgi:hypothetical protein
MGVTMSLDIERVEITSSEVLVISSATGADDGARLFAAGGPAEIASNEGKTLHLLGSSFKWNTVVTPTSNMEVKCQPGATIKSVLTPLSAFPGNYPFYVDAPSAIGSGTLASTPAIGASSLSISITGKPAVGQFVQISHGVSSVLYKVTASNSSSSPWTVTIDKPINQPWVSTDTVAVYASRPERITWSGGKMTGSGDQLGEVARCDGFTFRDVVQTADSGIPRSAVLGLDNSCRNGLVEGCRCDLTGATSSLGLNGFYAQSNDNSTFRRCYVANAYSAGITLFDCFSCTIDDCHADSCVGIGLAISSLGQGPDTNYSLGSYDCVISGGSAVNCATGAAVAYVGPSYNCAVLDFAAVACTSYGILVNAGAHGVAAGTRIERCDVRNSVVGVQVASGALGTRIVALKADNCTYAVQSAADLDLVGLECTTTTATNGVVSLSGTGTWRMRALTIANADATGYGVYVGGAGRLELDGAKITGVCTAGVYVNAAATVVLRNVRVTQATYGVIVGASSTVIIGEGCDFTGCGTPISITGTCIVEQSGGIKAIPTTGGTTTLVPLDVTQNSTLEISGALGSNATINVPNIPGARFVVSNQTTGAQTVTIQATGGSGSTITQTKRATGYVDASSTWRWDSTER